VKRAKHQEIVDALVRMNELMQACAAGMVAGHPASDMLWDMIGNLEAEIAKLKRLGEELGERGE